MYATSIPGSYCSGAVSAVEGVEEEDEYSHAIEYHPIRRYTTTHSNHIKLGSIETGEIIEVDETEAFLVENLWPVIEAANGNIEQKDVAVPINGDCVMKQQLL
eukprot:11101977-Ditylum_brightwellii.AAC.1